MTKGSWEADILQRACLSKPQQPRNGASGIFGRAWVNICLDVVSIGWTDMSNDADSLFFIIRKGEVWACWLDARVPIKLGAPSVVIAAMNEFLSDQDPDSNHLADDTTEPCTPENAERQIIERATERYDVSVIGKLRTSKGASTVTIHDLSEDGCQIYDDLAAHSQGDRVTIRIGSIGPIGATVMWCSRKRLGVRFENALHSYVVDHIRTSMDFRS